MTPENTWITAPENDRKRATFQTLTLLTPDPRNDPRKHVDYCPWKWQEACNFPDTDVTDPRP